MRRFQVRGLDAATGVDVQAISQSAQTIRMLATAVGETGESLVGRWAGLPAVYRAPEAADLERAMAPVGAATADLSSGYSAVSSALETFAQDMAGLKVWQRSIAAEFTSLAREALVAGDWSDDPHLVARQASLQTAAAQFASGVDEAKTRCAEAIDAARSGLTATSDSPPSCVAPGGQQSMPSILDWYLKKWPFRSTSKTSEIKELLISAAWRKNIGVRGSNRNDDFLSVLDGLTAGTYSINDMIDALVLMSAADRTELDYYLKTIAPPERASEFSSQVLLGARSSVRGRGRGAHLLDPVT